MKTVKTIMLVLVFAVCALLAYRAVQPPVEPFQIFRRPKSAPSNAECDQSLWNYVYNPGRLQVLDPCISVTGNVQEIREEPDGDVHIRFRLDKKFESLLNEENISRRYGDLILEPICQGTIRQENAEEPCTHYNGPHIEPQVGQRYQVRGAYVHDADHGWNELHPVASMPPIQ